MVAPPPSPPATITLPLVLAEDASTLQRLLLVRRLLVDADHQASAEDPLSRMSVVLMSGTCLEMLLKVVHEHISSRRTYDLKQHDIENEVLQVLKPNGLKKPARAERVRLARNLVAHEGVIPSSEETRTIATTARAFAADVVQVAWSVDFEHLTSVELVQDDLVRLFLGWGYSLLHDPKFEFEDATGHRWPADATDRESLAVGLAKWAFVAASGAVIWPRLRTMRATFRPHNERNERSQEERDRNAGTQEFAEFLTRRESALRRDLIAFTLGVRQADVLRFDEVRGVGLSMTMNGTLQSASHGDFPSEQDARFALDFSTDWALRAQAHSAINPESHPIVEHWKSVLARSKK